MDYIGIILLVLLIAFLSYVIWFYVFSGTLNNIKLYRRYKGGIWYCYSPIFFPYICLWTQYKTSLYSHEIITETENYTKQQNK